MQWSTNEVLDRIRKRQGFRSDHQLCKVLGISAQVVSNWRTGKANPGEQMCLILGEAAGLDPDVLAALMQAKRARTDEGRRVWERIARRLEAAPVAGGDSEKISPVLRAPFAIEMLAAY